MTGINELLFLICRRPATVGCVTRATTRGGTAMAAVRTVLVIGGGAAGTATAILLAEGGVSVDLIELKPAADTAGSGITLQGNALRVLRRLGVWDDVTARGFPFDSLGLRAPDPHGSLIAELTDVR